MLSLLIGRIIEKKTGKSISRVMDSQSKMQAIPVKIGDKIIRSGMNQKNAKNYWIPWI